MSSIIFYNFDDNTDTDIDVVYNQFKNLYPNMKMAKTGIDIDEMLEEEYLLALAEERLKNSSGIVYSFDEILSEHGITREELDNMEEVEIE